MIPKMTAQTNFDSRGVLSNPSAATLIIGVLVKRLGGRVVVTQEDIDAVAFCTLGERLSKEFNGELELVLVERKQNG